MSSSATCIFIRNLVFLKKSIKYNQLIFFAIKRLAELFENLIEDSSSNVKIVIQTLTRQLLFLVAAFLTLGIIQILR